MRWPWRKPKVYGPSRVVDMDDAIAMLDPDASQFSTILMAVDAGRVRSRVEWLEDTLFPRLDPRLWTDWGWVG